MLLNGVEVLTLEKGTTHSKVLKLFNKDEGKRSKNKGHVLVVKTSNLKKIK